VETSWRDKRFFGNLRCRNDIPVYDVDIRQIRYFAEVASTRSFKGAASRLNISQSSLSRRVADLERSLNSQLLVRHPRGVSLTRRGEAFLERANAVLREFDSMLAEVSGRTEPHAGVVTVGSSGTVSSVLLAPLAARFQGPRQRVRLRFVDGAQYVLLEGLDAGRIDVALITTPEPVANCRMEVLREDQLYLITRKAGHRWRKALLIKDLGELPLIMFPRPSTNRKLIELKARESGIELYCKYESSSALVQLEFARLGLAGTILPRFAFTNYLNRHSLQATPIRGLTISQTLVWRTDLGQSAIVAEVAQAIRSVINQENEPRAPKRQRRGRLS
jgi:LysR family nitrogen assimilation transcriptional regulator